MRNLSLVVAALLLGSSAEANPPRYSRKPALELDVKLSNRVRPNQPATAAQARPVVDADDVMRGLGRAEPVRREQERILERLIADTPDDDPEKPDIMFRLAEHYARQLRFWRIKAIESR